MIKKCIYSTSLATSTRYASKSRTSEREREKKLKFISWDANTMKCGWKEGKQDELKISTKWKWDRLQRIFPPLLINKCAAFAFDLHSPSYNMITICIMIALAKASSALSSVRPYFGQMYSGWVEKLRWISMLHLKAKCISAAMSDLFNVNRDITCLCFWDQNGSPKDRLHFKKSMQTAKQRMMLFIVYFFFFAANSANCKCAYIWTQMKVMKCKSAASANISRSLRHKIEMCREHIVSRLHIYERTKNRSEINAQKNTALLLAATKPNQFRMHRKINKIKTRILHE